MKILFISSGDLPDYQSDTIMHGGRSVLGSDFVDANFCWYMYKKERELYWNKRVPNGGNSYGRGMTLHGSLPECEVDRSDIDNKINNKFFDFIIYGSASRCTKYLPLVAKNYSTDKVAFIDGEDDQIIRREFLKHGKIFKRELATEETEIFPISFGAPKNKIVESVPDKVQDWATVIPGKLETYIFNDEFSYYLDYQKSYFALTHKKGGWDCMRHYEILLNGCVPYFPDIEDCPNHTMADFPKELCKVANELVMSGLLDQDKYKNLSNEFLLYTKNRLTTEVVFNKMISYLC